jgi:GxxExxY protein
MSELVHGDLTYQVRGALFEVYNALGPGFKEETYKIATCAELESRGIPVDREFRIDVSYKGTPIDFYKLDIVADGKVILELKAVDELHPRHEAQMLSYLKASGLRVGFLVNFGSDRLKIKRFTK